MPITLAKNSANKVSRAIQTPRVRRVKTTRVLHAYSSQCLTAAAPECTRKGGQDRNAETFRERQATHRSNFLDLENCLCCILSAFFPLFLRSCFCFRNRGTGEEDQTKELDRDQHRIGLRDERHIFDKARSKQTYPGKRLPASQQTKTPHHTTSLSSQPRSGLALKHSTSDLPDTSVCR